MMGFDSGPQEKIYKKIEPWMKEMFGMMVNAVPDRPLFLFNMGQTITAIAVAPWGDDDATITCRSYVVMGPELTTELMHYLLRENDTFRFGGFGVDNDGDVFFGHTIVGSTCDKEELKASTLAVASTAERYADEIIPKFGGERQVDKIRHMAG
jgi:hypothetical protein